jgi:hypothetical protein
MEIHKKRILKDFREELVTEAPHASPVLEFLDRTQLTIRRVEPADSRYLGSNKPPRTWLLYSEPEPALRERFDLAPELLVVIIPAREAQVRDIQAAEQFLLRDYRLDRGLVLVVAQDEHARAKLEQQARETRRMYIFESFANITVAGDPQAWLRRVLFQHLGSSDLFAPGPPVYGWDFVGRAQELERIRKHLRGGRPIGLYGLRKIGKTSLIFNLRKQLLDESRQSAAQASATADVTVPVYLDVQKTSFLEQNRAGFLRGLIRAIYEALDELEIQVHELGLERDLNKTRNLSKLDPEQAEKAGLYALEILIDWARERPGQRRIVLFIDEYERLLDNSDFPQRDGLQILTYLRGLLQSHPGVFAFLIAGRSRQLASKPSFDSQQNPLLNLLIDFPLAGMEQQEMNQLMSKIGRRLSLDFGHDALVLIWEETGGHPSLGREFGRLIDQEIPTQERNPTAKCITSSIVAGLRNRFRRQVELTLQEIGQAVSKLDPAALLTLSYVQTYPQEARVLAELPSGVLDELCRFGILQEQGGRWRIRIGCFGDWVQKNYDSTLASAAQG